MPLPSLRLLSAASTLACPLFLVTNAAAQISAGGTPTSSWANLSNDVPTAVMPPVDVDAYLAEDAARGPFPLHYGALIETELGLATQGKWEVAADGTLVWRLRIQSPGAHSLGLEFTSYLMPKGAQLFLYDDAKRSVFGAYTDLNERPDGGFVIEPFPGDALTVEYVQPTGAQGEAALVIGTVIHDYRNVFELLHEVGGGAGPSDGACLVDVNCPSGAAWTLQKRAVVRTLSGGGLCSASLLNNTANNGTPYVATANHCGQSSNTVFLFKYEKSGCGSGTAPTNQSVSGCTVLTTNGTYDGRLLQITSAIPSTYQPFYGGWSRSTSGFTSGVSIGHPSGGPKKICTDSNGASLSSTVWNLFWNEGLLEGGSSGGPLYDQNKRFRGQAWFVSNFNCGSQSSGFGRFDQFWNINNLKQWLDPLNSNPTQIDGFDPFGGPPLPPTITTLSPASVQAFTGGLITLTGTKFTGATQVIVGTVTLAAPSGFSVVNDTSITFGAPAQVSLGIKNVTVVSPGGTSNAKTLNYVETHPPQLAASPFAGTGTTFAWSYGAGAADVSVLGYSTSSSTFPFLGYDLLTSSFLLKVQTLSSLGFGSHSAVIPLGASGITFFSQVGTLDGGTGAFVGASPFATTFIF